MKLVPITLYEEVLGDDVDFIVTADAQLDLDSGDINVKSYYIEDEGKKISYNIKTEGLPSTHPDFLSTSGLLKIGTKELEFAVDIKDGAYEVNADQLEEIKEKALSLAQAGTKKNGKKKN